MNVSPETAHLLAGIAVGAGLVLLAAAVQSQLRIREARARCASNGMRPAPVQYPPATTGAVVTYTRPPEDGGGDPAGDRAPRPQPPPVRDDDITLTQPWGPRPERLD